MGKLGSGKLKLKLKLKSYPVPKSLHVSYLIFCYKLKDFNDTLDDGDDDDDDDRSANWNCLLKVRITEQAEESTRDWGLGTGNRARPAPWSSPGERPNKRNVDSRSRSRHLAMGAKMPRNAGQRARPIECAVCIPSILSMLLLTAGNSLSVFIASIKMDTSHLQAGNELDSGFVSISSICVSLRLCVFVDSP